MPVPVLLLGFNRPERLHDLVDTLRATGPAVVRMAIDGPRAARPADVELVARCQNVVNEISWTSDVRTLFRDRNVGLQQAVTEAVSWVLEEFESVIVIEDDVTVGPQFVEFASRALHEYRDRSDIFHVSGYNVAPQPLIGHPEDAVRLSRIPESFAWATWRRAWEHYDPSLDWGRHCNRADLVAVAGSTLAAARWRQNFALAESGQISSWAYRWVASIWSQNGFCVSPNKYLITYRGYSGGT
ncbi:MAG: nucleotide-diphospho-sugar transferase, partial [Aeromicrobium sp.]|nr:nucleotide-diphospho-sugar transferase [Aeromicrobium sp.]